MLSLFKPQKHKRIWYPAFSKMALQLKRVLPPMFSIPGCQRGRGLEKGDEERLINGFATRDEPRKR